MALREVLADLRVRVRGSEQVRSATAGVNQAVTGLQRLRGVLGGAAAALSSALAVREVAAATAEVIRFGDGAAKAARQLGVSADTLRGWRFAAERSGVGAAQLTAGLRALQRNALAASLGSAEMVRSFRALGVEVEDENGRVREFGELMPDVANGLGRLGSATERAAYLSRIFGESGAALIPLFEGGADGIEVLLARFRELGGEMGGEFYQNAEAAADALSDYELVMSGVRAQLVAGFLPALTRAITAIAEWTAGLRQAFARSSAFQVALGLLAGAAALLVLALLPVIVTVAAIAAPIALAILLIEDLVTMFRGGQSVIGDFLDELFGVGTAASVVQTLTQAWEGLTFAIRSAYAAIRGEAAPTLSGRSEIAGTVRGEAARQRRTAALEGRVVGSRGQTYEQALEAANASRAEAGLPPIGAEGAGGGSGRRPRGATLPTADLAAAAGAPGVIRRGSSGDAPAVNVAQDNRATVSITVDGARDPSAVAAEVSRQTEETLGRVFARAAGTLPRAAGGRSGG